MPDLIERCRAESVRLLRECATPYGFSAAATDAHYGGVWGRDALITSWGALASGQPDLRAPVAATLMTLAAHQAPHGQIPAVVWPDRGWWDWGDAGATDTGALFALTAVVAADATGDAVLWEEVRPACDRALHWLAGQDAACWGLVDSPPAADWMDSTLNRGGKVLSVNACYAAALRVREARAPVPLLDPSLPSAAETAAKVNLLFWPEPGADPAALLAHVARPSHAPRSSPHPVLAAAFAAAARAERGHYCAHVRYGHFCEAVDVLGNALAVGLGVAPASRARRLLEALDAAGVADPYPARSLASPATPDDDSCGLHQQDAEAFQDPRWRNSPWQYHNAGVWPYVGAVLAAANAMAGRRARAMQLLERCAAANAIGDWGFHEWLDGRTGEAVGTKHQAWNAGAFLLAYAAVAGGAPAPLATPT